MLARRTDTFISRARHATLKPYYGWVIAYDARTLRQDGVFNAAPDAGESGIWQADAGIAADAEGNVYAVTGNGKFTAASGGRDYGDSVLKLGLDKGGITVRDYFTPFNEAHLNSEDADLGSSGPVLLPDQPGPHPTSSSSRAKRARYTWWIATAWASSTRRRQHAVQTLCRIGSGVFGAPAYWNGHLFYFGTFDVLKDFSVSNGKLSPAPGGAGTFTSRTREGPGRLGEWREGRHRLGGDFEGLARHRAARSASSRHMTPRTSAG